MSMYSLPLTSYIVFCRRNKVSAAAREKWPGNDIPTFKNNKEKIKELDDFVAKLSAEHSMKYFGPAAIKQHILDCLTERRRSVRKGYDYEKVSQIIIMYFIVTVKFHCAEIQDTKN